MFWKKKVTRSEVAEIEPTYRPPQIRIVENGLGEFRLEWIGANGETYPDRHWTTLVDARRERDKYLANAEREWQRNTVIRVVE